MTDNTSDTAAKKVKYIASIIYLLIFTFIVGGTYINQQMSPEKQQIKHLEIK
ncbi:MAG: hypothetical protein QM500_13755 [Methylococcales bacterium]